MCRIMCNVNEKEFVYVLRTPSLKIASSTQWQKEIQA